MHQEFTTLFNEELCPLASKMLPWTGCNIDGAERFPNLLNSKFHKFNHSAQMLQHDGLCNVEGGYRVLHLTEQSKLATPRDLD